MNDFGDKKLRYGTGKIETQPRPVAHELKLKYNQVLGPY